MEKITVIKASEQEILDLINQHYGTNEDSIVALEELSNQEWNVSVSRDGTSEYPVRYNRISGKPEIEQYMVRNALDILCYVGLLEAGDYIIDCTW